MVLERLAGSGWIRKKDHLLDYGSGKGRVELFLAWQLRCRCTGIDYDPRMIETAEANRIQSISGERVKFIRSTAEAFVVPPEITGIYFFNPFSVEILRKVMARIRESWYECPREIMLFFYYPSDEYVADLMMEELVEFQDEIDCRDLFLGMNDRERIMIYKL